MVHADSTCISTLVSVALLEQGQVYAWGHNRVAQLGIGNSYTVPRNGEGAHFLPSPQLVESLLGMVRCDHVRGRAASRLDMRRLYPLRSLVLAFL